jgi:hypothetical protein
MRVDWVMSARYIKIGVFVLLLAGTAFVADALSLATPTPNANVTAKLLLVCCFVLVAFHLSNALLAVVRFTRRSTTDISAKHDSRTLIVMICTLLC